MSDPIYECSVCSGGCVTYGQRPTQCPRELDCHDYEEKEMDMRDHSQLRDLCHEFYENIDDWCELDDSLAIDGHLSQMDVEMQKGRTPGVAEIADDEGGYCPQTADEFIDWKNIELADDDVHDYIKEAWHLSAINADRLRSLAGEGAV